LLSIDKGTDRKTLWYNVHIKEGKQKKILFYAAKDQDNISLE